MTKRVILFGLISAMIVSGCGRQTPAETARPIALGAKKAAVTTPAAVDATLPVDSSDLNDVPYEDLSGEDPYATEADEATDEEEATPEASPSPSPTPTPTPSPTPSADEDEEDEEEASPSPSPTPTPTPVPTAKANKFVKSIGNGSLHTAHGIAVSNGKVYVVDNQRTGLLGKYASVRVYDVTSGEYENTSFENIAWGGAKNMPATVTRVKIASGKLMAADETTTYSYDLASTDLIEKTEGTFPLVTEVKDPVTGDTFKLNGNKIDRIHDGEVVLSFGEDVLGGGNAIAVTADGTLFVSEKTKGLVHQFAPAEK